MFIVAGVSHGWFLTLCHWFKCSSLGWPAGRSCSYVWLFWRTVLYSANQTGEVGTGCVQVMMGLQCWFLHVSWLWTRTSPEWRAGWHRWMQSWMQGKFVVSVPVLIGGWPKPDSDGSAENRLDDSSVKLDQQFQRQVEPPELAQELHPLLGLFDDCVTLCCFVSTLCPGRLWIPESWRIPPETQCCWVW